MVDEAQKDTEFKSTGLCRLNTDGSLDASFTANTGKLVPSEILVRNDNTFVVTGRFVVPGNHQIGLFSDNGDFKNGIEFAAEKSEIKRIFKQSDTQYLVVGNIILGNQSNAVARYQAYQAHIFRLSTDSYFWQKTISYGSVRKDVRISPVMA